MSSVSALTSAALNMKPASTSTTTAGSSGLDFMKLLMAPMQNQDPMAPQSGTDFMAQVAQFSQLDGINKLNQSVTDMMTLQGLTQGANLIGKNVTYANAAGNPTRGAVSAVSLASGKVQLVINGNTVDLSQVRTIEAGTRPTPTTTTSV
jgi:flagellar basal-body rod modification protein FlgD